MEQIKIQGISYRICVENNLIRDSGTHAEINFVDRIICIDSAIYGTDRGNIALLHEVIHGIKEQKAALARLLQKRIIESFYDDVIVDDEGAEEILRNI